MGAWLADTAMPWGLGLVGLALAWWWRRQRGALILAVVAMIPLGAAYAAWRAPVPGSDDLATLTPRRWIRVEGRVAALPQPTDTGLRFVLEVERVTGPWPRAATGRAAVSLLGTGSFTVGDRLELSGGLRRPGRGANPGEGDDRARLARQGITTRLSARSHRVLAPGPASAQRLAASWREAGLRAIARHQVGEQAALLGSLLLGSGASPLDPELTDRFRTLGLAHVLAVSGAQVLIVQGAARGGLMALGVPRALAGGLALGAVAMYALMTGIPPSIARACVMAGCATLGWVAARPLRPGMALWLGGALLLLLQPAWVHDLGFAFSMLATAALVEVAPRLAPHLRWLPGGLRAPLAGALATTLLVTPLQLGLDGQLSAWSIPANLLLAYLIEVLTLGGAVLIPLGVLLQACQLPEGWLAWPHALLGLLLQLMQGIIALLAGWPGARVPVGLRPDWAIALAYLGLALALVAGARGHRAVAVSATLLAVAGTLAGPRPPTGLRLTMLSVGQGDALVLRTPGGRWFLVDAGPAWEGGDAGRAVILPYLRRQGVQALDGVILTHPHADHLGGMRSVLRGIAVRAVWDPGLPASDPAYQAFLSEVVGQGIPLRAVRAGAVATLEPGVSLEVLNPPPTPFHGTRSDANNNAIAMRLVHGRCRVLLAADLETEAERHLARTRRGALASDVLKACHHGSRYGSSADFLAAVAPRASLISVGARNTFRHPDPITVARLRAWGPVYRTDRHGALEVSSDGQRWAIVARYPAGDAAD